VEHVGKINKVAGMEFMRVGLKRFSRGQEAEIVDVTISLDYLQDPKSITIEKRKALFAAPTRTTLFIERQKIVVMTNICLLCSWVMRMR
jgi:hypothetical protein